MVEEVCLCVCVCVCASGCFSVLGFQCVCVVGVGVFQCNFVMDNVCVRQFTPKINTRFKFLISNNIELKGLQ